MPTIWSQKVVFMIDVVMVVFWLGSEICSYLMALLRPFCSHIPSSFDHQFPGYLSLALSERQFSTFVDV